MLVESVCELAGIEAKAGGRGNPRTARGGIYLIEEAAAGIVSLPQNPEEEEHERTY
jgi:hypothetical protein